MVFGTTVIGRDVLPPYFSQALIAVGALLLALYALHARRSANPILDLRLLDIETFRTGVLNLMYAPAEAPAAVTYEEVKTHLRD